MTRTSAGRAGGPAVATGSISMLDPPASQADAGGGSKRNGGPEGLPEGGAVPTKQGDLALLNDPVAQELLRGKIPARLAYTWTDGTPRVVPIGVYWNGEELVMGTPPARPKIKALRRNPAVAITIDTETFPNKVLLIRGAARMELLDEPVPEWAEAGKRLVGDEEGGTQMAQQLGALVPLMGGMMRIRVRPEWAGILDFEPRFPSEVERAVAVKPPPERTWT